MDIIPSSVLSIIQQHFTLFLHWFSDEMYRRLLGRAQDEFLVRLKEHLAFTPLEQACAAYHHQSGPGARPTHTVPRLVRALIVKYLLDLSLRQLEQTIQWNLLVKWFVGYALFESGPDHSTLERFELWVYANYPRSFFDEVLTQIDRDFPEERQKAQIGDTYALCANAARESVIQLVRHSCKRLLVALGHVDPESLAQIKSQLTLTALFGVEDEIKEFRLDTTQRKERLEQTVVAALHAQTLIRTHLAAHPTLVHDDQPQGVEFWLDTLDKILADEVAIQRDEQGQVLCVQELPKAQKGSYRIGSATDPDATYRVHGERTDFGYNVNVAATDTFVREIRVDTGCQPDPVAIPALLTAQQEHHDLLPTKFIYDQAAGTGKSHAVVEEATKGQTQLVAPIVDYAQRSPRFGPDDFLLAPDGLSLTCPHGQVSTKAYPSNSAQGRAFRFSAKQCAGCPLVQACRGDKLPADHMRQVFISDHRSVLAKARTYAQTAEFRADMTLRSTIEREIANLVRYHGARQARRRGQPKCDFQAKMNATAFNIRQWMRQLDRRTISAEPRTRDESAH